MLRALGWEEANQVLPRVLLGSSLFSCVRILLIHLIVGALI